MKLNHNTSISKLLLCFYYCIAMRTKQKLTQQDLRLARYVQKIRKSKRITQEQLAEKVGVSTTWIGYIETGRYKPSLKLLYKIARVLGVKVKDLIPF